jgi:hypothetical protein
MGVKKLTEKGVQHKTEMITRKDSRRKSADKKSSDYDGIYPWHIIVIVMMCLILNITTPATAFVAYDCENSKISKDYAMINVKECPKSTPTNVRTKLRSYYLYELKEVDTVTVRECKIERKTIIFYCGMHSHTSIIEMEMFSRFEVPSYAECIDYFTSRVFRKFNANTELRVNGTSIFTVMRAGSLARDGECTSGYFHYNGKEYKYVVAVSEYSIT